MTGQSQQAPRPSGVRPPPPITPDTARAWVDVDLGALVRNGRSLARRAGVPLLPMVKADGYGLGAVPVARALDALEPWGFGVAALAEGRELRVAGIARPILVTTPLLPDELTAAEELGLTPALHRVEDVRRWGATGRPWHLSIDTGMHRAGVRWDLVGELRDAIAAHPPQGAFTHFHSAERGDGSAARQAARFREALAALPARPPLVHAENSAALERVHGSEWNLARPGVFLYGVDSDAGVPVEPVAALRARVVDVRTVPDGDTVSYTGSWRAIGDRRVATIAAGYADGYRRVLSNRGGALLHGRRASVVGVVTMDMTMLDVTDVPCAVGDVATLLGRDGDAELTIREVALAAEMMSPYEVLTGLRARPPRRYHASEPAA